MKEHIQKNLEVLASLSVQETLNLLLNDILYTCIKGYISSISTVEINDWIARLGVTEKQASLQYINNPHKFLLWMFMYYKSQTISSTDFHRLEPRRTKIDVSDLRNTITIYVRGLIFYEAISYLGTLMGAWILSCPNVTIREDVNFEKMASYYQNLHVAPGGLSSFDVYLGKNYHKSSENEKTLIFVLDYQVYLATDLWLSP